MPEFVVHVGLEALHAEFNLPDFIVRVGVHCRNSSGQGLDRLENKLPVIEVWNIRNTPDLLRRGGKCCGHSLKLWLDVHVEGEREVE